MSEPTRAQFVEALKLIRLPRGRQLEFLRAHLKAPERKMTARALAKAVGYRSYRGINLQYGILGRDIGQVLGKKEADIRVLVSFVSPHSEDNAEWILVMKPQFADALVEAGWL